MVKFVVFPVLIVVLAMHTPAANAFGIVRVDIQQDNNGVALANAIGSAISSKLQSWNSILNSLLQVKYSYGTVGVSSGGSSPGSSGSSTSGTGGLNLAPFYQKTVNVIGGTAATRPPSGQVAARLDANDEDNEVSPASSTAVQGSAPIAGRTVVTVNKSLIPSVSVTTSGAAPVASGSASVAATASVPNSVGYTYRKRYISY